MAKVYVATEGSYSDYRILGVFATADAAAEVGEVEEYELWEKVPAKRVVYRMRAFAPDYEPRPMEILTLQPWDYSWEWVGVTRRPRFQRYPNEGFEVSGTSRALVEKAFQDRRAEFLAKAEGIA